MKQESSELLELVQDMYDEFERVLHEASKHNPSQSYHDALTELRSEYRMNTQSIDDITTISRDSYYVIRRVRDALHEALETAIILAKNEERSSH